MKVTRQGVVILSRDQLAWRYDVETPGLDWSAMDLTDLATAGTFLSFALNGRELYLTTHNSVTPANGGLWYCPDFMVANQSFTLLKDAATAAAEAGYGAAATFGSIDVRDDGDFGAALHRDPGVAGANGAILVGNSVASAWWTFPLVSGAIVWPRRTDTNTLYAVYADSTTFYIATGNNGPPRPSLVYSADGIVWNSADFTAATGPATQHMRVVYDGFVACSDNPDLFANYDPAQALGVSIYTDAGLSVGDNRASYMYGLPAVGNDLLRNGVVIGDPSTVFGALMRSGHARFFPGDTNRIAWVVMNQVNVGAGDRTVAFTDDQGTNWQDRTDNLYTVLGGAWNGEGNGSRGNSTIRLFEYSTHAGGHLIMISAGAGRTYTTQDGTVYLKKYATFDPFIWGGRCMRVDGESSENLGAFTVTNRLNPLGGLERDGVLVDPPQETTFSLMMKRKQADRQKSDLVKCFWIVDQRMFCRDPQAWNNWEEITRHCFCKANTRTITGTTFDGSEEEAMVGVPQTCMETRDIYRVTGEELNFTAP